MSAPDVPESGEAADEPQPGEQILQLDEPEYEVFEGSEPFLPHGASGEELQDKSLPPADSSE